MARLWSRAVEQSKKTPDFQYWLFVVTATFGILGFIASGHHPFNWVLLVFWTVYLLMSLTVLLSRRRNRRRTQADL